MTQSQMFTQFVNEYMKENILPEEPLRMSQLLRESADNVERASLRGATYCWSTSDERMVLEAANLLDWYEKRCAYYQRLAEQRQRDLTGETK